MTKQFERLKAKLVKNGREINALEEKALRLREGRAGDCARERGTTFKRLSERFYLSPLT
jgi:hypothetical protein